MGDMYGYWRLEVSSHHILPLEVFKLLDTATQVVGEPEIVIIIITIHHHHHDYNHLELGLASWHSCSSAVNRCCFWLVLSV